MSQGHLILNRSALISRDHLRLIIICLFDALPVIPDCEQNPHHSLPEAETQGSLCPSSPLPSVELDAFF